MAISLRNESTVTVVFEGYIGVRNTSDGVLGESDFVVVELPDWCTQYQRPVLKKIIDGHLDNRYRVIHGGNQGDVVIITRDMGG